jgi:IS30 family transposase
VNGRSHTTANYYLNHPIKNRKVRLGQKRKLSARDDTHIGRLVSNKMISSRKIRSELNLNVSPVTIRRSIKRGAHIIHSKKRKTFKVCAQNKIKRMEFSRIHQTRTDDWKRVLFSDEISLI